MNGKIIFRRRSHLTEDEVIAGFLENDSKVVEVVKKEVVKIANYQVRKMLPKANRDLVNEFAQDALSKLSEVIITKTPSYHKNYLGFCTLCIRNTIFNIKRDPKTIDTEFLEQIAREPRVDDDGDIKHFEMLYSTRLAAMYYCVAALEEPCNNLINLT
ncbi:MAG TPA: hypothetical protein PLT99_13090, partial [Chitinophagales bacterium]|nr:hypothetical protein [Chitinophagales bacterium]